MTAIEPSDQALMLCTVAGDCAAFEALAARYLLRLRRAALHLLDDPAAAEDVAQDTLLRAWAGARRYDPTRASVSTWLHRIAVNAAIDRLRAWRPVSVLSETIPDPAEAADLRLEHSERWALLAQAIATLPSRQRAALALIYADGRSGRDAARALCVSARALEGLLRRARLFLRDYLEARDA